MRGINHTLNSVNIFNALKKVFIIINISLIYIFSNTYLKADYISRIELGEILDDKIYTKIIEFSKNHTKNNIDFIKHYSVKDESNTNELIIIRSENKNFCIKAGCITCVFHQSKLKVSELCLYSKGIIELHSEKIFDIHKKNTLIKFNIDSIESQELKIIINDDNLSVWGGE